MTRGLIDTAPSPGIVPGMAPPKINTWSRDAVKCSRCKRDDRPHHAKGLCKNCYHYLNVVIPWLEKRRKERKELVKLRKEVVKLRETTPPGGA